jgi:hypothetical protein
MTQRHWTLKLSVFVCLIVFYACIYYVINRENFTSQIDAMIDSFYNSVLLQTLTGTPEVAKTNKLKLVQATQSIIGFLFMVGFIMFLVQTYFNHN